MAGRLSWSPSRGDMIWIDCSPQVGREMKDVHPLLVLSPREFNVRTGIVIGLPMTTARYNETNPFAIRFVGPKGAVSYILGHQIGRASCRERVEVSGGGGGRLV